MTTYVWVYDERHSDPQVFASRGGAMAALCFDLGVASEDAIRANYDEIWETTEVFQVGDEDGTLIRVELKP